jgi:hypothetical protein
MHEILEAPMTLTSVLRFEESFARFSEIGKRSGLIDS